MTVYVDQLRSHKHKKKMYSHMVADSLEELHAFAESCEIKRCWFHNNHYDLNPTNFQIAISAGASLVDSRTVAAQRRKLQLSSNKRIP